MRFLSATIAAALALCALPAGAGTTGSIRGHVVESVTGASIAGAVVKAASPSQTATATTDAGGNFVFISLEPDTYTVTAEHEGYDSSSVTGMAVFSDQTLAVTIPLAKALKTIASTRSRAGNSVVKPGTTGDVFSVNPAGAAASQAVAGSGGLNTAYSAIATAPGVNFPQGQNGWNQLIYVRGGDYTDVSTEVDGIPVTRASDLGTATGLSSLGQQEVQIYTGGTPASDSSALAGFVNQVIKTGKYPGYAEASLGVGAPAFYHNVSVEAGGATPDRLFSYYVATEGADQTFRYGNQENGAGNPLTTWPLYIASAASGIYDGSGPAIFGGGANAYGMAYTQSRETIANLHFGIPHHLDGGRDDIQLLYLTGDVFSSVYSSINDLNMPIDRVNGPLYGTYTDTFSYNGPMFHAPVASEVGAYFQPPWTAAQRAFDAPLGANNRDTDDNAFSIEKLQYQRNFDNRSYLRVLGYSEFTSWYINGPPSSSYLYGADPQNFEVRSVVFGGTAIYSNELSSKQLLTATLGYNTQSIVDANPDNYTVPITYNYVGNDGQCFAPKTGLYASCYTGGAIVQTPTFSCFDVACAQSFVPAPTPPVSGTPAAAHDAQWLVTENGQHGQFDTVRPEFTSVSLTDQWRPNDRWIANFGARFDGYTYLLANTAGEFPARPFWFAAWNRENCYVPGNTGITPLTIDPQTGASLGPNGKPTTCSQLGGTPLVDSVPASVSQSAFQPRFGATYTMSPDSVLRASWGIYAQPVPSQYYQYDTYQQDLASFISQFLPLGFNSPYQSKTPAYSASYDLSLEQHIKNTPLSFKITPYYRNTWQQGQAVPVGTQGFLDAFNVGQQRNYGVELLLKGSDFERPGFSFQLGFTFSHSQVRYGTLGSGQSYLDTLNNYIQQYNSYTKACAGKAPAPNVNAAIGTLCGVYGNTNAYAIEPSTGVTNPYFGDAPQPLFDRSAWYTPYDTLPAPFQGATGYAVPAVGSLVLNYRAGKLAVTPSFTYSVGSYYGSPLVWPGYDPNTCAADPVKNPKNTQTCYGYIFTPDLYTGVFDAQGAFRDPEQLTGNLQLSYDLTPRIAATVVMTSLINECFQRGYAWDNATTCQYDTLPSSHLAPVGNFYPVAAAPIELRYPYGAGGNAAYNGQSWQRQPFNAFFNVTFKL